jgi:hypothetical protein
MSIAQAAMDEAIAIDAQETTDSQEAQAKTNLLKRYAAGERIFAEEDLCGIDLSGQDLSWRDLQGSQPGWG